MKRILFIFLTVFIIQHSYSFTSGEKEKCDIIHSIDKQMVFVSGGEYTMGCTREQECCCDHEENPAFIVKLDNFYISKYEITQLQWEALMKHNPSKFEGDNIPVDNVSWDKVQIFIERLNNLTGKEYRLPTEAEWEYAARGGAKSKGFKYSGSNIIEEVGWYSGNSNNSTHEVGLKLPNELGLYDMSGNVREWCSDWYRPYNSSSKNNPKGPTGHSAGTFRILRGGNWCYGDDFCRVSDRDGSAPFYHYPNIGFRLVCSDK